MSNSQKLPQTIDDYIHSFPSDIQKILQKVRKTIRKAAPEAVETINYQMPTFKLNGKNLVHFAAWKSHIGFYATPSGNIAFQKELAKYKTGKGSIQFPLDQEIPYELIREIVTFRVQEVNEDFKTK